MAAERYLVDDYDLRTMVEMVYTCCGWMMTVEDRLVYKVACASVPYR